MQEACAKRDLVQNAKSMFLLWGLPPAVMLLSVCCAGHGWIVTLTWTLSLAVMGSACLVNTRGCGRARFQREAVIQPERATTVPACGGKRFPRDQVIDAKGRGPRQSSINSSPTLPAPSTRVFAPQDLSAGCRALLPAKSLGARAGSEGPHLIAARGPAPFS